MENKKNPSKKSDSTLFDRYKLLIEARNFHYENFNKWMTYFYVATGAIFLGYINIITSKTLTQEIFEIPVVALGYVTGLLLYWSSKGYYYWNINFIMLVNYYEKELLGWKENEGIYSVFANKKEQNDYLNPSSGANFSTSKIAILFAFIITFSWGIVLFYLLFSLFLSNIICSSSNQLVSISLSIIFSIILTLTLSSIKNINNQHILWSNTKPLIDLEIKQ